MAVTAPSLSATSMSARANLRRALARSTAWGRATRFRQCSPTRRRCLKRTYGVPMTGATLHTINTRLDAEVIAFQLDHANAQGAAHRSRICARHATSACASPRCGLKIIDVDDVQFPQIARPTLGECKHTSSFISSKAILEYAWRWPADEWEAIALGYTHPAPPVIPKGVVTHHRGAYLHVLCQCAGCQLAESIRCICGRCRCFIATAGVFLGQSRL